MSYKLLAFTLLLLLTGSTAAQTPSPSPTQSAEDAATLEKEAVEFLRETSSEVGRLRTLENRISFDSELASLMWFHDEREARGMYTQVISDFKQLLSQFDSQMNAASMPNDDEEDGGFLFSGRGQSRIQRKFTIAMAVRQQIALSLAEHAPDMAYDFYVDSVSMISNPELLKNAERLNRYFESRLLQQIAESDAAKGLTYGKDSIKRGINSMHIELLRKLYKKDAEKGIEFGRALFGAVKSDPKKVDDVGFYSSLLNFANANLAESKKAEAKPAVYSTSDLRDIAELFYQAMMDRTDVPKYNIASYISTIETYAPGRAAQLRVKYKLDKASGSGSGVGAIRMGDVDMPPPPKIASNSNTGMNEYQRAQKAREDERKTYEKRMDDLKKLGSASLPKEEREKVIAESRKIISETKGKDKKLAALTLLAVQVKKMGDKDLAGDIMRDAERLVDPMPNNYQDYFFTWMLAGGYAETDPDKAFPLLESAIQRANDTISAFVKVAEFIDVQKELIDDGEVQVGMFGGEMIRGMTRELGMASGTIRTLVNADFTKTRALTNTFDRTETRVLAKMMILRVVLDNKKEASGKPKDTDPDMDSMPVDIDGEE